KRSPVAQFAIRTPYYVLTMGLAVIFLYPLLWTAIKSFAPQGGSIGQPKGWGPGNYKTLLNYQDGIWVYLKNSLIITILCVVITLFLATLGGYAFARFSFPGKNILFLLVLAILMVPYATLLLPLIIWLKSFPLGIVAGILVALGVVIALVRLAKLRQAWLVVLGALVGAGLVGLAVWGLWQYRLSGANAVMGGKAGVAIVLAVFQLPFAVFMMRISFEAIPKEIEEAALIDGCGSFGALVRIMLYAVKPGLITVGIFALLAAWNDFMVPLFLLNSGVNSPMPLAMVNMRQQVMGTVDYGVTEAGVVFLTVPCVILFLALQRHYVRGFMSGALKG
ncbi:MAG: carbohydrate ABC transporter permease, partial [Bifidobacteriaceae bacterium]|nr:carbohydrate ABC transporter permease [Bifidobacteriaceae bacterium]